MDPLKIYAVVAVVLLAAAESELLWSNLKNGRSATMFRNMVTLIPICAIWVLSLPLFLIYMYNKRKVSSES